MPRDGTGHSKQPLPTTNGLQMDMSTNGHHQTVNTKIRLLIFFVVINGEAPYNQQKQDCELTGA